ncbi:MAG: enoyl-CoA hydratase/isomerase family protein [Planctomycetes bacterium]|nr:enoyl-CoA hydratase/isomerase family protein [Planctomycetota bacterium]MCH8965544.1 enoyl-CoA hydratase/isomerase family protein [Planctomycetota bacterium]MCH8968103.1 enoyl-CoA hydratase/isomerase family protein [Planctomycetota bacterium]
MSDVILSEVDGHVGIVRLNRPDVLNALSLELMKKLVAQLEAYDDDPNIYAILLSGSEKVFAAGADITDMADASTFEMYNRNQFARWERIKKISKPIVAAVSGYALGGGCELAMHCDIIIASETAKFGQPEINIGVMPGAGGTQRLTRAVGKAVAMDVVLTGRFLSAREALSAGLVSRVVPKENFYDEALRIAQELAKKPPLALRLAKESVLKAHEMSLSDGLEYERKLFYMLFATEDQKEGMKAFIEKRRPEFKGK